VEPTLPLAPGRENRMAPGVFSDLRPGDGLLGAEILGILAVVEQWTIRGDEQRRAGTGHGP